MTKRYVYKDEWWPVYTLSSEDDYDAEVDISDDLARRYKTYLDGFNEVQDELEALYNKAKRDAQA